jgi:hypothetical protein
MDGGGGNAWGQVWRETHKGTQEKRGMWVPGEPAGLVAGAKGVTHGCGEKVGRKRTAYRL